MINLLAGLGGMLAVALILHLLKVTPLVWIPAALLVGAGLFIYLGRRVQGELEKIFGRASELLKKQQFEAAIEVMKEGYRLAPWQFLVKSSIHGQIGVIQYIRKKHEEAEPLLRAASMHHYIAKAMLGVLLWRRGEKAEMRKTFELAIKSGKKESILYAIYAYVLNEMKERDEAIEVLGRGLRVCKGDERLQTNLTLLQNKKPLKMKVFGDQWYQFLIERPMVRVEPPPFARVSKRALRG